MIGLGVARRGAQSETKRIACLLLDGLVRDAHKTAVPLSGGTPEKVRLVALVDLTTSQASAQLQAIRRIPSHRAKNRIYILRLHNSLPGGQCQIGKQEAEVR